MNISIIRICLLIIFTWTNGCTSKSSNGQKRVDQTNVQAEEKQANSNKEQDKGHQERASDFPWKLVPDSEGGFLPRGAIQRFGNTRFRTGYEVSAVAYSVDGKHVASGDKGGQIILWDPGTGRRRLVLEVSKPVRYLAFSPNSKLLASCQPIDPKVYLWDTTTGKKVHQLEIKGEYLDAIAFTPEGKYLASRVNRSNRVAFWDVSTGKLARELKHESIGSFFELVAFSPDGKLMATDGRNNAVVVINLEDEKIVLRKEEGEYLINKATFSPDGKVLATLWLSTIPIGLLAFWDIESGNEVERANFGNYAEHAFAFNPDWSRFAIAGNKSGIKLMNFPFKKRGYSGNIWKLLMAHNSGVADLAMSSDGKWLVSGGKEGAVAMWDMETGQRKVEPDVHTEAVLGVDFSPDGKILATGSVDKTVRLWDVGTGKLVKTFGEHERPILDVVFSPDGSMLLSRTQGYLYVWDMKKLKKICHVRNESMTVEPAFDKSSKKIAASVYNYISIFESKSCKKIKKIKAKERPSNMAWLEDGSELIIASRKSVSSVDPKTGDTIRHKQWKKPISGVALVLSPDGKKIAGELVLDRGNILIKRSDTADIELKLKSRLKGFERMSFSKDSKHLAMTDGETIQIWELEKGNLVREVTGHVGFISAVVFSPDGCLLASVSDDSTAIIWETGIETCMQPKNEAVTPE